MKHCWIACGVFALCLAVGLCSVLYVRTSGEQTNEKLTASVRQAEREVDEVVALFAQLEQFVKLGDQDDYLAACQELIARIEHVRRMELPAVENVM